MLYTLGVKVKGNSAASLFFENLTDRVKHLSNRLDKKATEN